MTKIKSRKVAGLDEIPPELWKIKNDVLIIRFCNTAYKQNTIKKWTKGCILPFPKKVYLGIPKNCSDITISSLATKVYNVLLLNRIKSEIGKISWKKSIHNITDSDYPSNYWRCSCIIFEATLLFVDFSKAFDSILRGKMEQILLAYSLPKETVTVIMMLYWNTKVEVRSTDIETDFFDILARVLRREPYH